MRRHGKLINVCLALLCIVLVLVLGGLVVWNRNQTREDKQRLEKLADETRAEDRENLQKLDKKQEETAKELQQKAAQEAEVTVTPAPTLSPVPSEPVKEKTAGISCWGDDLLTAEDTQQYSYMTVLQKLLQENG